MGDIRVLFEAFPNTALARIHPGSLTSQVIAKQW